MPQRKLNAVVVCLPLSILQKKRGKIKRTVFSPQTSGSGGLRGREGHAGLQDDTTGAEKVGLQRG